MRIVCQKCSAAYAIDDKFVTPKGVRAQCPRCRHLQLVKKDDAPAAPAAPAPGASSPFLFDMGGPPAPPPPGGGELHFGQTAPAAGAAPSPFDFSSPTGPTAPMDFSAPSAPGGNPFDFGAPPAPAPASSPFDFGAAPSGPPAANPFDFSAPAPGSGSPFDFGAPPPPAPPSGAPPAPRLSAPRSPSFPGKPPQGDAAALATKAQAIGVRCRTCGKDMTDPFDQALGVCDDCRNKVQENPFESSAPVSAPAAPAPAPAAGRPAAAAAPLFPTPAALAAPEPAKPRTAVRDNDHPKKLIGLAVGGAVVLVVGAVLAIQRPWVAKPPPLVVRATQGQGGGKPVDSIVQQWRLKYPDLEGASAPQLVDEGEAFLVKDTTSAYLDAEEAFQQALVLDPGNERALAGWVLSVAFGRPGLIDEPTAKAAESMLSQAEQRSGDARTYVAHAHFLIARGGTPNDIKVLAERGLSSGDPRDQALAALAVGQTALTRNPQDAARNFREALEKDPKLKRAYFFQSQLAAIQGKYKEATRALERRLELDADQWEAAEELARLLVEVGELPRAKKVLESAREAAARAPRPRLGLAIFTYQHLGDLKGAEDQLMALIDDAEVAKGSKADALVHLATLQRMQGNADKAADTLERALEINPDSVPAKLQRFLVLLDKGVTSSARLELDGLKGKLGDKYLEGTLEGRMLIQEDRQAEAMQALSAVIEADARRVDAVFLAGAAAAKARKDGKAWEFCLRRGLRADPMSRPVPALTPLFVRPADLLKPAVGAYSALVKELDEDPSPSLCEGLVAWYSEDFATAEKHFAKVNSIDPKSADAFAYRAMIALRRKDVSGALKLAARGQEAGKTNALASYAQAQALSTGNKLDQAKLAAQASLKYGPQLLGTKVILGDAEASEKNSDEARRVLTGVLLADPLYRDAKRVLYKHQL